HPDLHSLPTRRSSDLFISTRNNAPAATLSQAIAAGLAPDGGLYVPRQLPAARELQAGESLADTAAALLQPFFAGDALEPSLASRSEEHTSELQSRENL